jgi:2-polyprenyl-3-methyl-5-hydroxy-6-metoxy-1,4-benzoquinol methylase
LSDLKESPESSGSVLIRKLGTARKRLQWFFNSQRFGASPSEIYDAEFYDVTIDSQQRATAASVAEVLIEMFQPATSFDVGCGNGLYAGELALRSVEAFGCDGSIHAIQRVPEAVVAFQHDLKEPLVINRRFDLCTCFEVAEHIPSRFSENLVASCAGLSDQIVFSSAPPGQGGLDHINEQPDGYWDELFSRHEMRPEKEPTEELRRRFAQREVVDWLTRNTRVYRRANG